MADYNGEVGSESLGVFSMIEAARAREPEIPHQKTTAGARTPVQYLEYEIHRLALEAQRKPEGDERESLLMVGEAMAGQLGRILDRGAVVAEHSPIEEPSQPETPAIGIEIVQPLPMPQAAGQLATRAA